MTHFVTGAGTGIGKTLVTAALIHRLRRQGRAVRALKPVLSGYDAAAAADSDAGVLLAALGEDPTPKNIARVAPWRFAAPLAPDMAAAREGRALDAEAVIAFCRAQAESAAGDGTALLIEGVGGVMVPLAGRVTVADWIAALDCPAVLVAGSYLGALSHALTAAEALVSRGIIISAVVVSESAGGEVPLADTVATLSRFLDPVPVLALPRLAPGPRRWEAAPDLTAALADIGSAVRASDAAGPA